MTNLLIVPACNRNVSQLYTIAPCNLSRHEVCGYSVWLSPAYTIVNQGEHYFKIQYDKTRSFRDDLLTTITIEDRAIKLETDPLGLSPLFYSLTPDSIIVSDDLWLCAEILGLKVASDRYVAEMLFFGYVWTDQLTVSENIIKTRGSSKYQYQYHSMRVERNPYPFELDETQSNKSPDRAKAELLDLLLEDQSLDIPADSSSGITPFLLLSGGYDSRACLQAIVNRKSDFNLLNLGYSCSTDTKIAKLLAAKLDKHLHRVDYTADWIFENSKSVIEFANGSVNVQTGFLLGATRNLPCHSPLICGLYGDQITGDRLAGYKNIMQIADRKVRDLALVRAFNWGLSIEDLRTIDGAYADYILELVDTELTSACVKLRDLKNIDWRKRQLQYNQCAVSLLASRGAPLVLPFVKMSLIKNWAGLSDVYLLHQRLYRELLMKNLAGALKSIHFEKNRNIVKLIYKKLTSKLNGVLDPVGCSQNDLAYIDYKDQLYSPFLEIKRMVLQEYPKAKYLFLNGAQNVDRPAKLWFLYSAVVAKQKLRGD